MTIKDQYYQEIKPSLKKELGIANDFAIPKLEKIVINVGAGDAVVNKKVLDSIVEEITQIAGQKAVITLARKSISAFKIRKGMPIGVKVTLRSRKMYQFFEKLIKIVLPRFRDFSGIDEKCLDSSGNLNIGIKEQILFPEIDYDKIGRSRGLQVTIVTTARDREKGKKLLQAFGIPFSKSAK